MDVDQDLQVKAHQQIAVLTAVSANLTKETEEIDRQRQVVVDQIQSRYETGVRLLGESHDACLLTLKAATEQVKDKVEAEMDTTVALLSGLQAFVDDVAAGPHTSAFKSKPRPPLLGDASLRHFQRLSDRTEKPAVFSYTWSHNTEVVVDSVREFMGSVSVTGVSPESDSSRADSKERSSAIDTQPLNTAVSGLHATQPLALRSDLTKLRQDLTSAIDQLKQDVMSANDQLKQDVMSANDQLKQDVKKDVSDCERGVVVLQQSQTHTEKLMTDLQEQMGKLNTPVFFNTHLSKSTEFPVGATMVMDRVVANTGGGYDVTTGVFTAPHTGTYLFMATTRAYSDKRCLKETRDGAGFHIIVEGKDVTRSACLGLTSCAGHAVVRLDAGHKVWLLAGGLKGVNSCHALGLVTTFSGVLTQPEL